MAKHHTGIIKENKSIALDTYKIVFKSDMKEASAGQFVSILIPNKTLRRPFSISNFENGEISVLYKLRGEGTNYIKSLKINDKIDFMGALGNGFQIKEKKSLLVGAGIGIAPMLFLKNELNKRNIENHLISGFKSNEEILEGSDKNVIGGSVLDNIDDLIKDYKPEIIYCCGPEIVLKLISQTGIKHGIETQVAMEKVMACGIGVCRGCIIEIIEDGKVKNASVCKDGPVFRGDSIKWQI